jgi:hypothetical protein
MDEDEAFNVYFTINNWFRAFKLGRGEPRALH